MGHKKSIFIGISIVLIVIIITIITFVYSGGSCEHGTFPCGKGDNLECVPQHLICERADDCRDDYMSLCGIFYGYNDIIKDVMNFTSDLNLTSNDVANYNECGFEHGKCFCLLTQVICGNENLTEIPIRSGTTFLYLEENNIQLTDSSLDGLNLTHRLDLGENNISQLPEHFLHKQSHLKHLFLRRNHIRFIPTGIFDGLKSLTWLMLQENDLYQFPLKELKPLISLEWLDISHNHLRFEDDRFPEELINIMEIDLSFNENEFIGEDFFPKLLKLGLLNLRNNRISFIDPDAFNGLQNLQELRLANNKLTTIDDGNLRALRSLDALFIGNNPLRIDSRLLRHSNLSYLNLNGTAFEWIDFTAINEMKSIKAIFFTKFYFCSMTPHIKICLPRSDGLSSDKDLLSKPSLRYSAWAMAIVTCLGNSLVVWGRFTQRDENHAVSLVIRNLAVSDMLMGFYLSIIGIQDYRFRDAYHLNSYEWTTSWSCTFIGTIAMISSEVSLLILTFISIERFLLIAGPFGGRKRLTSYNVFLCLFIIWLIGISMAIIPAIYWRKSTHYYGTYTGTCFPLHLQERFPIGWEYSAAIFMGVNFILLVTIAVLYIALFLSIWRTQKQTPLGVFDYEFAIRFLFVVLVDTACWAPIIALKVFVFFSYEISADIYAFLVVFVLPLNSAVNPILYTFTTTKYRNQVLLRGWKKITSKKWHRNEGSGHTGSGHTGSGSNHGRSMSSYLARNRKNDEPLP